MARRNCNRTLLEGIDAKQRQKLWKARKQAFGAIGRLSPSYCTQDGVVPRTKLPDVLEPLNQPVVARYKRKHFTLTPAQARVGVDIDGSINEAIELVFHTASPNDFGHDRRSDRAQEMLLAFDTFGE